MFKSLILTVFMTFLANPLLAAIQAGVGLSSATSGRAVPGLEIGFGSDSWLVSGTAIGVKSAYYFHSNYTAHGFYRWKSGPLLWGEIESGVGGGVNYAVRGFQDEGSTSEERKTDFAAGPAYFVQWSVLGPVYLKVDMLWGLRGISQLVGLNGQDVIFFSLGSKAW